jgi:hypothetical protein
MATLCYFRTWPQTNVAAVGGPGVHVSVVAWVREEVCDGTLINRHVCSCHLAAELVDPAVLRPFLSARAARAAASNASSSRWHLERGELKWGM